MKLITSSVGLLLAAGGFAMAQTPTLLICSDSTTANYDPATTPLQGWGYYINNFTTNPIKNLAKNGRSTRSFIAEGLWSSLLSLANVGDLVLIEMGHNDDNTPSSTNDRATLPGIGDETITITNSSGKMEVVLTFGAYLRRMISDVQAKKAIPIISGMVPRNYWNGEVLQSKWAFADYAQKVATAQGVEYIDHTQYSVKRFQELGSVKAKTYYPNDNTHTNAGGALINAEAFVTAAINASSVLAPYLKEKGQALDYRY